MDSLGFIESIYGLKGELSILVTSASGGDWMQDLNVAGLI